MARRKSNYKWYDVTVSYVSTFQARVRAVCNEDAEQQAKGKLYEEIDEEAIVTDVHSEEATGDE